MKVRELFTDASKWTQGPSAKQSDGTPCSEYSAEACSWCLAGAINKCYDDIPTAHKVNIKETLSQTLGMHFIDWNEEPNRTFEEVKALVEKADV